MRIQKKNTYPIIAFLVVCGLFFTSGCIERFGDGVCNSLNLHYKTVRASTVAGDRPLGTLSRSAVPKTDEYYIEDEMMFLVAEEGIYPIPRQYMKIWNGSVENIIEAWNAYQGQGDVGD